MVVDNQAEKSSQNYSALHCFGSTSGFRVVLYLLCRNIMRGLHFRLQNGQFGG